MNKLFKRTTAFVLMVCLLCALAVPAVYAAPAEADKVVYDFELDQTEYKWTDYYFGGTPFPQTNSSAITVMDQLYAEGELNWNFPHAIDQQQWELDPETGLPLVSDKDADGDGELDFVPHLNYRKIVSYLTAMSCPHNSNYFGGTKYNNASSVADYTGLKIGAASGNHASGACTMNANGGWNALLLKTPAAGTYAVTMEYTKYAAASTNTGVYILPYTAEMKAQVANDPNAFNAAMFELTAGAVNKLGAFSSWIATGSAPIAGQIAELGEYTFSAAYDEYLMVMSNPAGKYAYIQNLTLTPVAETPLEIDTDRTYSLAGVVSANTQLAADGVQVLHDAYDNGVVDLDFIGTNNGAASSNFRLEKSGQIVHYAMDGRTTSARTPNYDVYKLRSPGAGDFEISIKSYIPAANKTALWANIYVAEYVEGKAFDEYIVDANKIGMHAPKASTAVAGKTTTDLIGDFTFGSADKEYVLLMVTNTEKADGTALKNGQKYYEDTAADPYIDGHFTANFYTCEIIIAGKDGFVPAPSYVPQAFIGETSYGTMAAACAAAQAGDTIKLAADFIGAVNLPTGVSLDLNGFTLDTQSIVTTSASEKVFDSKGTGKLIAQEIDLFASNDGKLPLATAGNTYTFADYALTVDANDYEAVGSKTRFWFKLDLADADLDKIAAGNTGLTIGVELAWEGGSLDVTFAEGEDEAAFAAAWAAAYKQNKNIWLYVDIAGLTGLESNLTVKPVLNSADSTLYTGSIVYTVG